MPSPYIEMPRAEVGTGHLQREPPRGQLGWLFTRPRSFVTLPSPADSASAR